MADSLLLLIAAGLLAAAVVLYLLQPLVQGFGASVEGDEDPDSLERSFRREAALAALRDAEYDYVTGKLDDADYRRLKGDLAQEALELLDDERTEEERKEGSGEGTVEEREGMLEEEIARIRKGLQEGRTCRRCAHLNPAGSRFCGRCGGPLGDDRPVGVGADEGPGGPDGSSGGT